MSIKKIMISQDSFDKLANYSGLPSFAGVNRYEPMD